jgi:hypothetical protein
VLYYTIPTHPVTSPPLLSSFTSYNNIIMSSRNLSVTEPHPSVPKPGAFISGGRGGVGNYRRYKAEDITPGATATGPASRISLSKSSKRQPAHTGRGGAGNVYKAADTEERVFQFDEEMVKKRELQAPVYHIGR